MEYKTVKKKKTKRTMASSCIWHYHIGLQLSNHYAEKKNGQLTNFSFELSEDQKVEVFLFFSAHPE